MVLMVPYLGISESFSWPRAARQEGGSVLEEVETRVSETTIPSTIKTIRRVSGGKGNWLALARQLDGQQPSIEPQSPKDQPRPAELVAPAISNASRRKLLVCNYCESWEWECTRGESVRDAAAHSCSRWAVSERWLGHRELGPKLRSLASNDEHQDKETK